ncbi:MAG: hypothetical protein KDA05_03590 [Phycisphaerales bacterium]|nr:hypothetical protein [Phycisphaerales bacterium]
MSVSGLVITLATDDPKAEHTLRLLAGDTRLTLGERFGRRVPAVAETPGVAEDRALIDDLRALDGVANVDVTFVALDEAPAPSQSNGNTQDRLGPTEPRRHGA